MEKLKELKILHLEDDLIDAELIKENLISEFPNSVISVVKTRDKYLSELQNEKFDLIFSDFSMPEFNGIEALDCALKIQPGTPFVFISGHIGEDRAIDALRKGARDYVLKERMEKLIPTVKRILTENEEKNKRIEAEERIKFLYTIPTQNPYPIFRVSDKSILIFANKPGIELLKEYGCVVGTKIPKTFSVHLLDSYGKNKTVNFEHKFNERIIFFTVVPIIKEKYVNIYGTDITQLKQAEIKIREREKHFRTIFEASPIGIVNLDSTGKFIKVNKKAQDIFGYSEEELLQLSFDKITHPLDIDQSIDLFDQCKEGSNIETIFEKRYIRKNKEIVWAKVTIAAVNDLNGNFLYTLNMIEDITQKKHSEIALKYSEQKFRNLFNKNLAGVFRSSIDGKIIEANSAFAEILGYSSNEEVISLHSDNFYVNKQEWSNILTILFEKDELRNYEIQLRCKTGETIWALLNINLLKDENNKGNCLQGTLFDISDKKKNIDLLQKSEEKFRTYIKHSPLSIFVIDRNGYFIDVNPAAFQLLKYPRETLLGMSISEISYSDSKNGQLEIFDILKNTGNVSSEIKLLCSSGASILALFNAVSLPDDKYIAFCNDITKSKSIEEALKISEEKYRSLIENIEDTIFSIDLNGVVNYISPSIKRFLGYEVEEIIGKNISSLIDTSRSAQLKSHLANMEIKNNLPIEIPLYTKENIVKWTRISRSPIIVGDELVGVQGVISDISLKKEAEVQLLNSKKKAEEMNRLKSNFLANMSHELRTPMIGILGGAEFLIDELKNSECIELAETIYDSGKRLLETLNLILDLSRIEAEKLEINYKYIDINSIVLNVKNLYEKAAHKKNLFIHLDFENDTLMSKIDERLFREILNNLVNNAIKFTDKGGITISTKSCYINGTKEKEIILKVEDTGIGIPKESISSIYNDFTQVSEGLNRNFEGTGLGLSLTKKFVDKLGGSISVESTEGKGTIFLIKIPTNYDDINEVIHSKTESFQKHRIDENSKYGHNFGSFLYFGENKTTKIFIKRIIQNNDLICFVNKKDELLKSIKERKYDILLIELNLGNLKSQINLINEIKELKNCEHSKIIAITALAMKGDKEFILENGFDDYLAKPFSKHQFISIISKYINKPVENAN